MRDYDLSDCSAVPNYCKHNHVVAGIGNRKLIKRAAVSKKGDRSRNSVVKFSKPYELLLYTHISPLLSLADPGS